MGRWRKIRRAENFSERLRQEQRLLRKLRSIDDLHMSKTKRRTV